MGTDPVPEAAVERQPAPVAVVSGQQLRLLVVFLRVHRICDERVPAVRSDDHAGALGDGWAAPLVTADADDAAMLEHEAVDRELLAYFDSRLGRGVDEQRVQHRSPGRTRSAPQGSRGPLIMKGPKSNS